MDKVQLVKLCQSGDREAFGILYQTYHDPMYKIVSYYVKSPDAVLDILHDGFIIAFDSINSLKNAERVDAWIITIMKNLSLRYLKDESNLISVPAPEAAFVDNVYANIDEARELTWEELDAIIDKLPKGYGKIFRLAVLDGLSHKEIAAALGIAQNTSTSQLTHAKAMLRRMITQYRIEMGLLSIIGIILLFWFGFVKHSDEIPSAPIVSENTEIKPAAVIDSIDSATDSVASSQKVIYNRTRHSEIQQNIAEVIVKSDSISTIKTDTVPNDTLKKILPNIINREELIAQDDCRNIHHTATSDWSLALTYAGSLELNSSNSYRAPISEIPSVSGPTAGIEVTEKARHYIPVVVELSINKLITPRWGIETGVRYTLLRSDFLSESKILHKETIQRIHYIGVPLKFNYRIFKYNGFSVYGQGGGALDIPVYGTQSVMEFAPKSGNTSKELLHIHAPLQWSVEGGLGIQYNFTPSFSIYAEPSLRYYFKPQSAIKTIRQDKPLEITIPIGLRVTW